MTSTVIPPYLESEVVQDSTRGLELQMVSTIYILCFSYTGKPMTKCNLKIRQNTRLATVTNNKAGTTTTTTTTKKKKTGRNNQNSLISLIINELNSPIKRHRLD